MRRLLLGLAAVVAATRPVVGAVAALPLGTVAPRYGRPLVMAASSEVQWEEALTRLDDICEVATSAKRWPHPRHFDEAIMACSRAEPSRWSEALDVLVKMREHGLMPRAYAFGGVISACARAGQWQQTLEVLDQMKKVGEAPQRFHFNAALSAMRVAGEWKSALSLLTRMRDRGVPPDLSSYGLAVGALRKGGRGATAAELVDRAVSEGLEPTERLMAEAIGACAVDGSHRQAESMWEQLAVRCRLSIPGPVPCTLYHAPCAAGSRTRGLWEMASRPSPALQPCTLQPCSSRGMRLAARPMVETGLQALEGPLNTYTHAIHTYGIHMHACTHSIAYTHAGT